MSRVLLTKVQCLHILASTILLTYLSACTSIEGKFTETTHADLGAFADQTIALMQIQEQGLREEDMVLTRQYLSPSDVSVVRSGEIIDQYKTILDAINQYSINLASFDLTNMSEAEKISSYVSYVESLRMRSVDVAGTSDANFSRVLDNVKQQTEFLNALQAVQPLVDGINRFGQLLLNEYEMTIDQIHLNVDAAIERDFESLRAYETHLDEERDDILTKLGRLYDREAAQGVDLSGQEAALIASIDNLYQLQSEIETRRKLYKNTHRELDLLYRSALSDSTHSRIPLLVWTRAHERMASGAVEEADWFTYKDIGIAALNVGRRLLR